MHALARVHHNAVVGKCESTRVYNHGEERPPRLPNSAT
jgi:hypothetical protein